MAPILQSLTAQRFAEETLKRTAIIAFASLAVVCCCFSVLGNPSSTVSAQTGPANPALCYPHEPPHHRSVAEGSTERSPTPVQRGALRSASPAGDDSLHTSSALGGNRITQRGTCSASSAPPAPTNTGLTPHSEFPQSAPDLSGRTHKQAGFSALRNSRRRGRRTAAAIAEERRAILLNLESEIDAIAAGMHALMGRSEADGIGVIYARYSTDFQHSIGDQVRADFEWAICNRIYIPREHIFYDVAITGKKSNRPGLNQVRRAIETRAAQTLVVFTTSRLFRKGYQCVKFVEEDVVGIGARCVFIRSGLDTAGERWRLYLSIHTVIDESGTIQYVDGIRNAHIGYFVLGYVVSTLPYGFMGEDCDGPLTKRFLVRQKVAIDPETALWVRQIFRWYAEEGWGLTEILEKLNDEKAPCGPMSDGVTWTAMALRYVLANSCYRGWWAYGKGKNKWMPKQDYSKRVLRDKPLAEKQFENLRLVSDEIWYRAQVLLAKNKGKGGRKPKDGDTTRRPRILNGMLRCQEHSCPLKVAGTFGQHMVCMKCRVQPKAKRFLYTYLNRALALKLICGAIADAVREDEALVRDLQQPARAAAAESQKVDTGDLDTLRTKVAKLTRSIEFIQADPGETDRDLADSKAKVRALRGQRAAAEADVARIESAHERVVKVPTEADFRSWVEGLEGTLIAAAADGDPADAGELRQLLELLTGGEITVEQMGERLASRGWLRVRFTLRVAEACCNRLELGSRPDRPGKDVVLDIREETIAERHIQQVHDLYSQNVYIAEIAERLGIERHQVTDSIRIWAERHGEAVPDDGRTRRAGVRKVRNPSVAEQIAERAKELLDEDLLVAQIAERLGQCRDTVTQAIRHWYESRGLTMPDLRNRRKSLKVKNRPKE